MGSRNEPDHHRAITLKPSPFHHHPDRVEETRSAPFVPHGHVQSQETDKRPGQSTAYETTADSVATAAHRSGYIRNSSEEDRDDIERQVGPKFEEDPYSLRTGFKSVDEIDGIKANISKKRTGACAPLKKPQDALHAHKITDFYKVQNENIERLLKPVDQHILDAKDEAGSDALQFKIAVNGSFVANVLLAILQIYGAVSSGSLSLFTTMADAIFDPLSNTTLILCNRAVKKIDRDRFPSGKSRIETAGNIAFCFLMTSVSLILIVESSRSLAEGSNAETDGFHIPSVIAVGIAFATKLVLFLYCWALRNKYSQIRILWEDHRNDLFINGFGLLTSVGGSKLRWWIDPAGAILLSVLIATLWLTTAYSEFQLLIGVTAPPSFLQHITYISMTHSDLIVSLDTVRAWHSGPRIIVEVDIVMDRHRTLQDTHDVAEDLQIKLERLPNVERAYVHVDYETDHAPEHFLKKEL